MKSPVLARRDIKYQNLDQRLAMPSTSVIESNPKVSNSRLSKIVKPTVNNTGLTQSTAVSKLEHVINNSLSNSSKEGAEIFEKTNKSVDQGMPILSFDNSVDYENLTT